MTKPNESPDPKPKAEPFKFNMSPVKAIPQRKYRKGSKYDPILADFMKANQRLVQVTIAKDANYVRTQLDKRIAVDPAYAKKIKVSVANNILFLERLDIKK